MVPIVHKGMGHERREVSEFCERRHSQKMGQKKSKASGSMQEVRGGGGLPDIPPDSPLCLMIQYWDASLSQKGKSREKMIHYCMEVWGGKQTRKDLYWPIFGSLEDWICQQLNICVNNKQPFNEEREYAFLWILGTAQTANSFPLKEKKKDRKKRQEEDELPESPPPYIPPPPSPQGPDPPPTAPPNLRKRPFLIE